MTTTKTETGLYNVSADTHQVVLAPMEVLNWAPAWLSSSERLMLYTLIYSLRPARYLEIGTLKGGSALIVAAAMDASNPEGRIVCIDLWPQVDPEHWRRIEHRATMVVGNSNETLPKACEIAGGLFDFVFIDADHSETAVFRDANKVLPLLADGGYLLFHDDYNPGVARATRAFASQHRGRVVDFGDVTREFTILSEPGKKSEHFCGFRLMQLRRRSGMSLAATWERWRFGLMFTIREKLPIPHFVRNALRALLKR